MVAVKKIGLGGGCHWCTEAVFQSLQGVLNVKQGFVASEVPHDAFSEGVIVAYAPGEIALYDLVLIHLMTHDSTAWHGMRPKYRSAIYTFEEKDEQLLKQMWHGLQEEFKAPLVTVVLPFRAFRPSETRFQNYYLTDPGRPFCKRYIDPKLQLLRQKFVKQVETTSQKAQ
ncbi:MAG: peptide-methionine (S)-S-oxide reductase [Flavobacteriaceae bacterium]